MRKKLEAYIKAQGLDTFGFIPVRDFEELRPFYQQRQVKGLENEFEAKEIEERIHPAHYMEDAKTIVSIAFPYLSSQSSTECGFSVYTQGTDYHRVVRSYLDGIVAYIESLGGKAIPFVDSNTLPERYIAYLAGVGFIGRNNMIITKKYGSYVFLGEIMTDLDLEGQEIRRFDEIKEYTDCGECRACYKECPSRSINAAQINPNICLSYLTQKKELSDKEIGLLKENVFGCDYCQLKCPYNEEAMKDVISEFKPLEAFSESLEVIAGMDNQFFKQKMSLSSCGWRGKNVLRRNAILQLKKREADVTKYLGHSEYINKYINNEEKNKTE